MSDLSEDRLFYGNIEECYYYDRKTGESKSNIIKEQSLLYNSGDYYIDLKTINLLEAFLIVFETAPSESYGRIPFIPLFGLLPVHFLCAFGGLFHGDYVGHRFVRTESLKEAYPNCKNQSALVKTLIHDRFKYPK